MKSLIITMLALIIMLVSCKKADDNKDQKLDANSIVKVTGVSNSQKQSYATDVKDIAGTGITDSLEYIAKYAYRWSAQSKFYNSTIGRSLGIGNDYYGARDIVNKKFLYWGDDIVKSDTELGMFVTDFTDNVFVVMLNADGTAHNPQLGPVKDKTVDTVAYIPNSVVLKARAEITEAFNKKDYATCYKLFDEAYVFIPTTGKKWRALKAAGIE